MNPDDVVKVLYGSRAYYHNCPAYCKYHHCHLTIRQIKTKHCLAKHCKCLDKIEHWFWRERERKKQNKSNNS